MRFAAHALTLSDISPAFASLFIDSSMIECTAVIPLLLLSILRRTRASRTPRTVFTASNINKRTASFATLTSPFSVRTTTASESDFLPLCIGSILTKSRRRAINKMIMETTDVSHTPAANSSSFSMYFIGKKPNPNAAPHTPAVAAASESTKRSRRFIHVPPQRTRTSSVSFGFSGNPTP